MNFRKSYQSRNIFSIIVLLVIFSQNARPAEGNNFGLGIILGDPTGLSFKVWQSNKIAYDAALAWSLGKHNNIHIHVDYLVHNYDIIRVQKGKLPFYFGIGGRLEARDESVLGLRIPLGMNYLFAKVPIDLFLELVPTLNIIPKTGFDLEGGIGARYYF